jgi:hypothetical protein
MLDLERREVSFFLFGCFIGCTILLFTSFILKKMSFPSMALFIIIVSMGVALIEVDYRPLRPFLDVVVGLISAFLFVRLWISISRRLVSSADYGSTQYKKVILMISVAGSVVTGHLLLNYEFGQTLHPWNYIVLHSFSLIATLFCEQATISDFSMVLLYSISFLMHDTKAVQPIDAVTVVRLILVATSIFSILVRVASRELDDLTFVVTLRKRRHHILLFMAVTCYALLSPGSVWVDGSEVSMFLGLATPVIYHLCLFYEHFISDRSRYLFI